MKEQEELYEQFESEGEQIVKYRRLLYDLVWSGHKINYLKLLQLTRKLNRHIVLFDVIETQLIRLEKNSKM